MDFKKDLLFPEINLFIFRKNRAEEKLQAFKLQQRNKSDFSTFWASC